MTDFAVLRAPSQVLFGAGMAVAAGRVAAGHGRRVLVITDPVIVETPGFATVRASLVRVVEDVSDLEARTGMLYGSLLAGIAFGNSGVSAAHALQFAVGAATHTSHGLGTGLLLPYVMEYNRPARPDELAELSSLTGGDAVELVHGLGLQIGLPASLAELGVAHGDLRGMAEASVRIKRLIDNNPRPLDVDALEAILDAAWHGEPYRLRAVGLATA